MFLVSLLAFLAGRWEDSPWRLGLVCLAVVITPVVVVLTQPANTRIAWQIWIIGIASPVVLGRVVRGQDRLTRRLGAASWPSRPRLRPGGASPAISTP